MGVGEVLDNGLDGKVDLFSVGMMVEWERNGDDTREHLEMSV